jgi:hypothetical protein
MRFAPTFGEIIAFFLKKKKKKEFMPKILLNLGVV